MSHIEPEAVAVDDAVRVSGIGRTRIYAAMNPRAESRLGLPHLQSFTVGRRRLIRLATLRAWLAQIEAGNCRAA